MSGEILQQLDDTPLLREVQPGVVVELENPGEYDSEAMKAQALANVEAALQKQEETVSKLERRRVRGGEGGSGGRGGREGGKGGREGGRGGEGRGGEGRGGEGRGGEGRGGEGRGGEGRGGEGRGGEGRGGASHIQVHVQVVGKV